MGLVIGRVYRLSGMIDTMWTAGHPVFGKPDTLAGIYLGCLHGQRRWHGFEIWVKRKEQGVIFMTDADLRKLKVEPIIE